MKKDLKILLGLLMALALCAAGYLALRAWNEGADQREAQAKTLVADLEAVTGLSWTSGGEALSFQKEEGAWVKADDPDFPTDQDKLDAIAVALQPLEAVRVFREPDALADYGLEEPAHTLTVQSGDQALVLSLGNQYEGNYYAKTDRDGAVYTVASTLAGYLDQGLPDLIALPRLPAAGEEELTGLRLEQGGTVLELSKDGEGWTVNGQSVPGENGTLNSLLTALASPRFTACGAYRPDAGTAAAWGLDDPALLTVTLADDGYTLSIGGRDDESGDYYARLGEDGTIYLVDASFAGTVLGLTQETLTQE